MSKVLGKIFKAVTKVITAIFKPIIDFVGDALGFAVNPLGAVDTPSVPDPGQQATGVLVTKTGTSVGIPIVYGHRQVGGSILFVETTGTSNDYLYVVYSICEGEIEGITKIFVDDTELPNTYSSAGYIYPKQTVIKPTSGTYANVMDFQLFYGTETQTNSSLANETPTWKTKNRPLTGLVYAVFKFKWENTENNPYRGGIPSVRFEVFGKKIFDTRRLDPSTDLIPAVNYYSLTKTYNFNPANCLLDYLINPRYGCGLNYDQIDPRSFRIAANKFEQFVNYSATQQGRTMTMNAVIDSNNKLLDNVKLLVGGCRGILPYVRGQYKLRVEDGGHPTDITSATVTIAADITNNQVIDGIKLDGENVKTKYNQVIVNYVDPDKEFSNQQVSYSESADITLDNQADLRGEFTFHTITNPAIARDLARMIYKKSRLQRQINFTGTPELLDLEIGDIIRVTDSVLDLNQQQFRVVSLKLNADGNVVIDGVEHNPLVYPFVPGPVIEIPPSPYVPKAFTLIPVARELPQYPVSITPALDPDYDSAGNRITIDNTSPESPPLTSLPSIPAEVVPVRALPVLGSEKIGDFQSHHPLRGPTGQYYCGVPNPYTFLSYNTWPQAALAYLGNFSTYTVQGFAQDYGNGRFISGLLVPTSNIIDELVVREYFNGGEIKRYTYYIRQLPRHPLSTIFSSTYPFINSTLLAQAQKSLIDSDIDTVSGLAHFKQLDYYVPYKKTLRVTWRSSTLNLEYEGVDGLGDIGWSAYTYRTWDGKTRTSTSLEAWFNYISNSYRTQADSGSSSVNFISDLGVV
ncbi:baseplate hub protein [Phage DSL-LC06]|nr:baseplate hub protein [Phage DSL-LC06]